MMKRHPHSKFIASLFTTSRIRNQPKCLPSKQEKSKKTFSYPNEWIRKFGVNIHKEIKFSHKKYDILSSVTTCMDLEDTMLNEVNQAKTETM